VTTSTILPSDSAFASIDARSRVADPRVFASIATSAEPARSCYVLAEACLAADTEQQRAPIGRKLQAAFTAALGGDGAELADILHGAPSVAVARQLWRALDAAWRDAAAGAGNELAVTVFALPVVIVTGDEGGKEGTLPAVLETAKIAAILSEHNALAGNRMFGLSSALVRADAIDIAKLPQILGWHRLPDALDPRASLEQPALEPAPLSFRAGQEAIHLRFIVGTAIAKRGADLLADSTVGKWGIPLTKELAAQLGGGSVSVLPLPRAPQRVLPAVLQGRLAQREVSAQVFAANAIRRLRREVGEPKAVISAHCVPSALGGGELRLSLSSPFDERGAEGFRCPIFPLDRVEDVITMLVGLVRDCRVTDIRVVAGAHADRVDGTGSPLFFKPDTIPPSVPTVMH